MPKTIQNIVYKKDNGETSERKVIVMGKPDANYKAIEVTDETPEQTQALLDLLARHEEELKKLSPKWKAFKTEGITFND